MSRFMKHNKLLRVWVVFCVMLSVSLLSLGAQTQDISGNGQNPGGKRIALVIGNDAYQKIRSLKKAGNDAAAMARELKAAGFEVLLHKDLNYRGMVRAVETFSNSITGGDQVVVFFAGHGVQIKSRSYLLPVDIEASSESEIEKTSYGLADLTEKLSEAMYGRGVPRMKLKQLSGIASPLNRATLRHNTILDLHTIWAMVYPRMTPRQLSGTSRRLSKAIQRHWPTLRDSERCDWTEKRKLQRSPWGPSDRLLAKNRATCLLPTELAKLRRILGAQVRIIL